MVDYDESILEENENVELLKSIKINNKINKKVLLECLEKMFYGKDSKFILSACYQVVLEYIEELRKEVKENEKY